MKTLLLLDFINEIVHKDGKLSAKGYNEQCKKRNVYKNIREAEGAADQVIHIGLGFEQDYSDKPVNSPLFKDVDKEGILKKDTWSTELVESVRKPNKFVYKNRISPFVNPLVKNLLKGSEEVYIGGVATDIVVQSTARDLHDLDFNTVVLEDCCAAASEEEHKNAVENLKKFVSVKSCKDI